MHLGPCSAVVLPLDSPCVHTCEDSAPLAGCVARVLCHLEEHSSPTGYSCHLSLAFSVPPGTWGGALCTHWLLLLSSLAFSFPLGHMGRLVDWTQHGKPFQHYDSVCFVLSPDALALLLFSSWEAKSECEQVLCPTSCCFLGSHNCLRCQEAVTERLARAALCSHVVPVRPIGHICTSIYPVQECHLGEATNPGQ